jgi:hypothetical protein
MESSRVRFEKAEAWVEAYFEPSGEFSSLYPEMWGDVKHWDKKYSMLDVGFCEKVLAMAPATGDLEGMEVEERERKCSSFLICELAKFNLDFWFSIL